MSRHTQDTHAVSDYELHAYVDGELDAARCLEVEAWLATHPEAMARVRDYRRLQEQLHERFDPMLSEPVDAALLPARVSRPGFARAAAMGGLMLASGLIGWSLHGPGGEDAPPALAELVQPAAFAHTVYSTDGQYPVEIDGAEQASLNRWVSKRMRVDLQAPDLAGVGLSLLGGRLLPSTNRMAAQFMYTDGEGKRLTVYVRRIADAHNGTDFRYREQDGLHVFYWIDAAMGYAVIGEHEAPRLIAVANAVQAAFEARSAPQRPQP